MPYKRITMRDSSLELFRIVMMLLIVAHHYVVNSGVVANIKSGPLTMNGAFLLCFGAWGKIAINCFVLITGYFMCEKTVSMKKFARLFCEIVFYNVACTAVFLMTGYAKYGIWLLVDAILPFRWFSWHFVHAYLLFFLLIPFLNVMIEGMAKRVHMQLVLVLILIFSVFPTIPFFQMGHNYVTWFCVVYAVGAYLRRYPSSWMTNRRFLGTMLMIAILFVLGSVFLMKCVMPKLIHTDYGIYFWVSDCDKLPALIIAVILFLFFKNLQLGFSRFINTIASGCFGVLLIHANSDVMRRWLWTDVCRNVEWYNSPFCIPYAIGVVVLVFTVCTVIDLMRQTLVEKRIFR